MAKNSLTIHGLWPSLTSGKYLPNCNKGEIINIINDNSNTFKDMENLWFSKFNDNEQFWTHEYNKHGYCYSEKINDFDPKKYFNIALDIFKKFEFDKIIKKAFIDNNNTISDIKLNNDNDNSITTSYENLKDILTKINPLLKFEIICTKNKNNNNQYFSELRYFFDLNFEPIENYSYRTNCKSEKDIIILKE